MRDSYDVRVYLAPPEDIRREWKVKRDTANRGYSTEQVLQELERREADSETFIRPQQRYADMVISFMSPAGGDEVDPTKLDAELVLREGLPHPDLSPFTDDSGRGVTLVDGSQRDIRLRIAGDIDSRRATEIEEAIWEKMHFASHLRTQRLGEFKIGKERHRSSSLGIVQLLILYHLATAKAIDAVGGEGTRAGSRPEKRTPPETVAATRARSLPDGARVLRNNSDSV